MHKKCDKGFIRANKFLMCELDRVCHAVLGTDAKTCEYFNVDVSNKEICFNCKNFLGGGDWGLSCSKEYLRLCNPLTKACKDFDKKQ